MPKGVMKVAMKAKPATIAMKVAMKATPATMKSMKSMKAATKSAMKLDKDSSEDDQEEEEEEEEAEESEEEEGETVDEEQEDDETSDESSVDEVLRDRIKARKFRSIWATLDDQIRKAYTNAKGSGRGDARDVQTKIINQVIRKNNKGNYVVDDAAPILKEIQQRSKEKYYDSMHEGVAQHM